MTAGEFQFQAAVEPSGVSNGPTWWFVFHERELIVVSAETQTDLGVIRTPYLDPDTDLEDIGLPLTDRVYLGTLDQIACWAGRVDPNGALPTGYQRVGLRELFGVLDDTHFALAGRAIQLLDWETNHRYCGRCGAATEAVTHERAKRCPTCGLSAYPRLAPAVITLIERDDGAALLARSPGFAPGRYGLIAGFVEPGESLEEAVRREIWEEVGCDVTDVRYFGSQPWPFPNSLMVGFTARWVGGDLCLQPGEIEDAGWFFPDGLPDIPAPISIARRLIDDWLERRSRQPC